MSSKLLNQSEYARYKGVSAALINVAVKNGKITLDKNGKIDPVLADEQWAKNTDPKRAIAVKLSDQEAYSRKLAAEAKLKEFDLAVKEGQYILADDMNKQAFEAGRLLRTCILSIPHNICNELAVESNPKKCEDIVLKALKEGLRNARIEEGD